MNRYENLSDGGIWELFMGADSPADWTPEKLPDYVANSCLFNDCTDNECATISEALRRYLERDHSGTPA